MKGLSAVQFAERETIDQLRQWRTQDAPFAVALDAADPASLAGGAVTWPSLNTLADTANGGDDSVDSSQEHQEHGLAAGSNRRRKSAQPMRKTGSVVVFIEGKPILYAMVSSHHLVCFEATDFELQRAVTQLADILRAQYQSGHQPGSRHGSATFRDVNGEPLTALNRYTQLLRAAGFISSPQGMKLYR
ncbi:hypothetical protein OZX57_05690 [Bifidobacterium sp. ESL0682]|uniref:hypothetical protein n=1 Tax=Bifidobacterium sp. ESL0682 TaxID=2983212 RepID=UPI0023FA41D5|nr:hypothetical protein [Bifidobacterium sp. ESL0682]WEV41518.1 hypothetical protein OZX57_05690 [Bifidobacterium sp. ESL0682]